MHPSLSSIHRFEIESALFEGKLSVDQLPSALSDACEKYLGVRPKDDFEGVLQDVHWSGGSFGYFPSYTLGNMFAAQLWKCARTDIPSLGDSIAKGDLAVLTHWLAARVHTHGKRFDTLELCRRATNQELSPDALAEVMRERFVGH